VLYSGRPGPGRGPDFLDAVLERDDGLRVSGDIEVHVRTSGWQAHGHGRDTRYNGVVLHVAASGDAETELASGRRVPLLLLGPGVGPGPAGAATGAADISAYRDDNLRPHGDSPGQETSPALPAAPPMPFFDLAAAGDQRFISRSSGFELEVRRVGADQALYAGIMECMGYSRNRRQFLELAARVPYRLLAGSGADCASALLQAAGFAVAHGGAPASPDRPPDWDLPGGRPDNHPRRRVLGMAALIARWNAAGGPAAALNAAVMAADRPVDLAAALSVQQAGERALIGRGRALAAVVNAVLPCQHAAARLAGDLALAGKCLDLYRRCPRLPDDAVSKEAAELLGQCGLRPDASRAREQMGLHLLYRAMTAPVARPSQLPLL
jgi:hypothetical protein